MNILFWSGGKDSFMALEFYRREHGNELKLLTTYDKETNVVPHQNIPIKKIEAQAETLNLELITIPLPKECPNVIYLNLLEEALNDQQEKIEYLVFGDWHLHDLREWREGVFGEMGYKTLFPIWHRSMHDLLPVLIFKPVEVRISAVKEEYQKLIRVGEPYNQRFIQTLPDNIDPMGENGEFHTEVIFKDVSEVVV